MWYIGIDPGTSGAIAMTRDFKVIIYHKCPVTPQEMAALIPADDSAIAIIEEVHGRGFKPPELIPPYYQKKDSEGAKWSAQNTFTFGKNTGMWLGILACKGIPVIEVPPRTWQSVILGKFDKGMSKIRSLEVANSKYKLELKNHNIADAVNLMTYCQYTEKQREEKAAQQVLITETLKNNPKDTEAIKNYFKKKAHNRAVLMGKKE
jgi:hypothetical protein